MEEKIEILSQEEEKEVTGGDGGKIRKPKIKVFCHQCGSENITKGIKFDDKGLKIYIYHCNECGNGWESLTMPRHIDK